MSDKDNSPKAEEPKAEDTKAEQPKAEPTAFEKAQAKIAERKKQNDNELAEAAVSAQNLSPEEAEAEYNKLRTEFTHIGNQPSTPESKQRQKHLSGLMAVYAEAYKSSLTEVEVPELEAPAPAPAHVAETPAEETPAEETPAVETPAVETPAAETPAAAAAEAPSVEQQISDIDVSSVVDPTTNEAINTQSLQVPAKPAGSTEPFVMNTPEGSDITTLAEFGLALQQAAATKRYTKLGSFNPYGSFSRFNQDSTLGRNPEENYRTIYGDDPKARQARFAAASGQAPATQKTGNGFTAAINCGGPAQPVQDIPFQFTAGRPLFDSGLIASFPSVNGQIQVYGCRDLPDFPDGILEDSAGCTDCSATTGVVCAVHECITPMAPMEPNRYTTCMCLPEDLMFANELVLEQTMREFAVANDRAYELWWMEQIKALSLVRTVPSVAPHGAWSTIHRALMAIKSRLALNPRRNGVGLADYTAFIPGGEAIFCAAWADASSRLLGTAPGEDILEAIERVTGSDIVFGLDTDPSGPNAALTQWDDETKGVAAPLESIVNSGSIAMIPRDTFATASPMSVELGLDFEDRDSVNSGCKKITRSEWMFDIFSVGCRDAIWLEFDGLCTEGSGPDLLPANC